ncbi:MAG TPA: hypothetical protein VKN64_04600 [Halanaerobiales bacterium]|nr:hypothetical protein [Halanaerobiales bacterium]
MKFIEKIKKDDGFAMVFGLILILVVITMATVLINISINEYSEAERNKNEIKAYFLARSGAEIMANKLEKESSIRTYADSNLVGEEFTIENDTNNEVISTISLSKDAEGNYNITSTAEVQGVTETIKVSVSKLKLFQNAIFAKQNIDLSALDLLDVLTDGSSSVESNGTVKDPNDFLKDENIIEYSDKKFTEPTFPSPKNGKIKNDTISESGTFKKIKYNNGELTIDFSDDKNNNEINIVVDSMTFKASMNFVDNDDGENVSDAVLNIFVNKDITFQTPNVDTKQFNIFLKSGAEMTLVGNPDTTGEAVYVYGPNANMYMNSAKTSFKGAVIVDRIYRNTSQPAFKGVFEHKKPTNLDIFDDYVKSYQVSDWRR